MVSDAIAAADGVWFADEPFAVFPERPGFEIRKTMLPHAEHSHFFALDEAKLEQFQSYTQGLFEARFREMGTSRRTKPVLRADRVCLKVLNAPWMIGWFAAETDAQPLVVLRHPGAQAVSVLRQGWDFPVRAYAKRPEALAAFFTAEQVETIVRLASAPAGWEVAVLDWIVTSAPLRAFARQGGPAWRYEDIVSAPERFVADMLVGRFGLSPEPRLRATFARPSGSSAMSEGATNAMIATGDRTALLDRWRTRVDDAALRQGQALLDRFGVEEYRFLGEGDLPGSDSVS